MNLRSLFQPDRLTPEWVHTADGLLWRLFCARSGRLIGECRDQERKTATFFCLDERTGVPLWKNLRLEESWWVGIEAVIGDVLILHTYAKPDMPQHRGIHAFDVATGSPRWRNDDCTFWFSVRDRAYAYRDLFEKRVGYEFDVFSGAVLRTFEESLDELGALKAESSGNQDLEGVVLPEPFDRESSGAGLQQLFDRALRGAVPTGSVDFATSKDIVAFSYYLPARRGRGEKPAFENHLQVYRSPDGVRLFSEVINENLAFPVPDTFFIRGPRLLFLKNQQSLISLRLWQS
jgi:hypothetical protein